MLFFQKLEHVIVALISYVLYYICQFAAILMLPSADSVFRTVVGSLIFIVCAVGIRFFKKKLWADAVCIKKISIADGAVLGMSGATFNIVCMVILSLIPFPKAWLAEYSEASSAIGASGQIMSFVLTLIIAPIVEELLFRGLVYGNLRCVLPKSVAIVLSAALFGVAHGAVVWVIYATFFGAVMAWIYEKYRSLAAPILFHFGFNLLGALAGAADLGERFVLLAFVPSFAVVVFTLIYTARKKEN